MKSNIYLKFILVVLFLLVLGSFVSTQAPPACNSVYPGYKICTVADQEYTTTTPIIKVDFNELPVDITDAKLISYDAQGSFEREWDVSSVNHEKVTYNFTSNVPLPNRKYKLTFNATDEDENVIQLNIAFSVKVEQMEVWVHSPRPANTNIVRPLFAVSKETPTKKFDIVLEMERRGTCEYTTIAPTNYQANFGTGRYIPLEANEKLATIKNFDVLSKFPGQGENAENSRGELPIIYVICKENRDDSFAYQTIQVGYDKTPPVINLLATPGTVTDYNRRNTSLFIKTDDRSVCTIKEKTFPPNENPSFSLDEETVFNSVGDYVWNVSDEILFMPNIQYKQFTYVFDVTCTNLADYANTQSITIPVNLQTSQSAVISSPPAMTTIQNVDLNISSVIEDPDGCDYIIEGPNGESTTGNTGAPITNSGGAGSIYSKRIPLYDGTNTIKVMCSPMQDYGEPYTVLLDKTPPNQPTDIEMNLYTCGANSLNARILGGDDNEGGSGFAYYLYNFSSSDNDPDFDLPFGTTANTPSGQKTASISQSLNAFDLTQIDGTRFNLKVWSVDAAGNIQTSAKTAYTTISADGYQFCDFDKPTISVTKIQNPDTSYWYMTVNCTDAKSGCNQNFRYSIHTNTDEQCSYATGSGVLGQSAIEIRSDAKFCAVVYDNNNNNDTHQETLGVTACQTITDVNRASCDFTAPTATVNKNPVLGGYNVNITCTDNSGGAGCNDNFLYSIVAPSAECNYNSLSSYQVGKNLPTFTQDKKICFQVYDKASIPNRRNYTELIKAELDIILETPRLGVSDEKTFDFIVKTDRPVTCKHGFAGTDYQSLEYQYQAFTAFAQTGGTTHRSTINTSNIPQFKNKINQPEQIYEWAIMCDEAGLYHIKDLPRFGYDTTPTTVDISLSVNPITDQGNMKTVMSVSTSDETVCSFNYMNGTNGYFTPYVPSDPNSYNTSHKETLYYWNIHEDADHNVTVTCKNLAQEVSMKNETIRIRPIYDVDITIFAQDFYNVRTQAVNVSTNGVGSTCKFRTSPEKPWVALTPKDSDAIWHSVPSATFDEGVNQLEVNCVAKFSQDSATRSKTVIVDTALPTVAIITNTKTCSLTNITAEIVSNGTGTDVVKYIYNLTQGSTNIVSGETTSKTLLIPYAYELGKAYVLSLKAIDQAGNIGTANAVQLTGSEFSSVECDRTPPVGSANVIYKWGGADINISCQDADSGCSAYFGYYLATTDTCAESYGMTRYDTGNPVYTQNPGLACFKVYDNASNFDKKSKKIEFIKSCFNFVEDPEEEGIDCGGPCAAQCDTCDNGEKDTYELGVDCGGVCENITSCGTPCTTSYNCPPNQICSAEKICVVDHSGDSCSSSNPCPTGYICDAYGQCQLDGGSGCITKLDCQTGYYCALDGTCKVEGGGPECFFDSDCGTGRYCDILGTCQDDDTGEGCNSDLDCGDDYYCGIDKTCHRKDFDPECYFDSDCGPGYFCSLLAVCEKDKTNLGCTSDTDCIASFYCAENSTCQPDDDGMECFFDSNCGTGKYCDITGTCQTDDTGNGCNSDLDCGDDFYCALDKTCKLEFTGPDCLFDDDCGDDYFCSIEQKCEQDTTDKICYSQLDCGTGFKCGLDGKCQIDSGGGGGSNCLTGISCDFGFYCSETGACLEDKTGSFCYNDLDCGGDFYCRDDGTCQLEEEGCASDFDCKGDELCDAGSCIKNTIDTDSDGLPDWWEDENFGDPTIADPADDPDDDGFTNLQEYKARTDPNDKLSMPRSGTPSKKGISTTGLILLSLGFLLILGGSGLLYYEYYKRQQEGGDDYSYDSSSSSSQGPKPIIKPQKQYSPAEIAARQRMLATARIQKESQRRSMFNQFSDEKTVERPRTTSRVLPAAVVGKNARPISSPAKKVGPIVKQPIQEKKPEPKKERIVDWSEEPKAIKGPRTEDDYVDLTQIKKSEKPKKDKDSDDDVFGKLKEFVSESKKGKR